MKRSTHPSLLWALLCFALLRASSAVAAGSQCPAAVFSVRQDELNQHVAVDLSIATAGYDSTFNVGRGQARIEFDHALSRLSVAITSAGWFGVDVQVVERFGVVGIAPGTSVSAVLVYTVDGWAENCGLSGCGVSYSTTLACDGRTVTASASQNGPGTVRSVLSGPLSLPITLYADSPVDASFSFVYRTPRFAQGIQAVGDGHYEVVGLPAGAQVVTCVGGGVTSIRRASWGILKLRYR